MTIESRQYLTAVCGDLLLARDCVANLETVGFQGKTAVVSPDTVDVLDRPQAYGSAVGASAARGALVSAFLGAIGGTAISTVVKLEVFPLLVPTVGVVAGALIGGISAWRAAKRSFEGRIAEGRFVLFCEGRPDELEVAFQILQDSACSHVQIHEGPLRADDKAEAAVEAVTLV